MSFAAVNRERARAAHASKPDLTKEVVRNVRERRILTQERNDLVLLTLGLHHDGTSTSDAHGRPVSVWLERDGQRLNVRLKWGSDGVPRLGPKSREALLAWFSGVPVPR